VIRADPFGKSYVALDLLRGLAAFAVFLGHARGISFVEFGSLPPEQKSAALATLFGMTRVCYEAVLIFFVLSGFLVGGQIISRTLTGNFALSEYSIDRCCRILLPLVPAVLFTELLNIFAFGEPVAPTVLLGNLAGLNGVLVPNLAHNAPLWSLAYEIWFYALGGIVGHMISRAGRRVSVSALAALLACAAVFSILSARLLLYWVIAAMMCLCLETRHKGRLGVTGFAVALFGVVCSQLAAQSRSFITIVLIPPDIAESLICFGTCLALPALCSKTMNERLSMLRKPAGYLAGFSYSLYLFHYPTLWVFDLFLPKADAISRTTLAYFLIKCGGCLIVAIVFYYLFERNTVALRQYFKGRILRDAASRYQAETLLSAR
jgi:peptidoglycan/LPS O-acetylase OafA/YrhL